MTIKSGYDITNLEDLIKAAHEDPRFIIESGFNVINKNKEIVPFIFNEPQNLFYEERTLRDDLLKAGQLGLSTEIDAILTVKFLLVQNSWGVIISHEAEATKRLFERVDFWLNNLPDWLKPFYIPGRTTQGDIENKFMHSKLYIGTAGSRAFGRGDTIHYVHMSENSRWQDDGRIQTGLIRAVPMNDPHTWIVKETTANGEGTPHHIEYQRAKNGESEFKNHFLPFFSNPDYKIKHAEIPAGELTTKEKILLERFPESKAKENKGYIDIPSLAWRRQMIKSLVVEAGQSPERMFQQEFPVDDQEAFLSSGNPIFSPDKIAKRKAEARPPIAIGDLEGVSENPSIVEKEQGWYKFFDMPSLEGKYIIFADVGQDSDFCVGTVVDRKKWHVVAKFRAQINAFPFGDELAKLGFFFNKALIAVEVNNMGQSTIDRLIQLKYPSLYMRTRMDQKTKTASQVVGWRTTEQTKALMIGHMQEMVEREEGYIPDMDILTEMSTFIKTETGGMEASPGNYDDCVISVAGAFYILKLNPFMEKVRTKETTVNKVRKFHAMRRSKRPIRGWGR